MRVVLALQYLRARRIRETRELTTRYAIGFGFAAAIWIALRPGAGSAAILAVDHSADRRFHRPLAGGETQRELPAHFPERFGLFTIILLGEFVASVMRGIESQKAWSVAAASTAFTSMAFAFALWCGISRAPRAPPNATSRRKGKQSCSTFTLSR